MEKRRPKATPPQPWEKERADLLRHRDEAVRQAADLREKLDLSVTINQDCNESLKLIRAKAQTLEESNRILRTFDEVDDRLIIQSIRVITDLRAQLARSLDLIAALLFDPERGAATLRHFQANAEKFHVHKFIEDHASFNPPVYLFRKILERHAGPMTDAIEKDPPAPPQPASKKRISKKGR